MYNNVEEIMVETKKNEVTFENEAGGMNLDIVEGKVVWIIDGNKITMYPWDTIVELTFTRKL